MYTVKKDIFLRISQLNRKRSQAKIKPFGLADYFRIYGFNSGHLMLYPH